MYIKYLNNIHNLSNYNSIVQGGAINNCIHLQKDNGHVYEMEFLNTNARDFMLAEIWAQIINQTKFFDLDNFIDIYYQANKYNL